MCAIDRVVFNSKQLFDDLALNREVLALVVQCNNENCDWTNELFYFQVKLLFHISQIVLFLLFKLKKYFILKGT